MAAVLKRNQTGVYVASRVRAPVAATWSPPLPEVALHGDASEVGWFGGLQMLNSGSAVMAATSATGLLRFQPV